MQRKRNQTPVQDRALLWAVFGVLWITPVRAQNPPANPPHAGMEHALPSTGSCTNPAALLGADLPAVALQPLLQQVRRVQAALAFLGQPLPTGVGRSLDRATEDGDSPAAALTLQCALDPLVLAVVDINAESRVKVQHGPVEPALVQGGSRLFLVKVINRAGVTAPLVAESPNSGDVYLRSTGDPAPKMVLTETDARERWANIAIAQTPALEKRLSGLSIEYQVLEVYARDAGQRSATISFNVGQGSQDIGFRNDMLVLFHTAPVHPILLHVLDESGQPAVASITIRDHANRIYPNPSKRLAPDFFFQPQVYRADGESLSLPPGEYTVNTTGGPEYRTETTELTVDERGPRELKIQLQRWVDPAVYGWYSGDSHVHAAGCSHYQNPEEGVLPKDMMRQLQGERLNIGAVLTWGPDYYYQKQFFSGHDDPLSRPNVRMHYDLEVSGFPSSHSGHLVLLGLKDQDYPNTKKIEDWPTWDLPILQWAKAQGALVGFAHSGWGLQVTDKNVPSFQMPGFDGIGANEYIVDVTEPGAVDFISAGDTPYVWELSIWYHTLNVGFRTRIIGETDFPCIDDDRVGEGRSYVKLDGPLTYAGWLEGLKAGRSYVSDGRAHLMDYAINGVEAGTHNSEVSLAAPGTIHATVKVAAMLGAVPDAALKNRSYDQKPYWAIERARVEGSREVPVELVVNGKAVASRNVPADGKPHDVAFETAIDQSSWVAMRILPAAHTNPIFVMVAGKPVRASRASAEWDLKAVRQCWSQKAARISQPELPTARAAYDHAEEVYRRLLSETAP